MSCDVRTRRRAARTEPRVVVHVGAHKTGTSLVQKYFRDRRRGFLARGVSPIGRSDGNRIIGWGDVVSERPLRLRRRIEAEFRAGSNIVLVSHENSLGHPFVPGRSGLYPMAPEYARCLSACLEGLDVTVVFYVRQMADFVESYYLQTIHEGAWHSFDKWARNIDMDTLAWSPVIAGLDDAFGRSRVAIGEFAEIERGQTQFLRTFMARAGLPQPRVVAYYARRNASVSEQGLALARELNPTASTRAERRLIRRNLQGRYSNVTGDRARPMPAQLRASLTERTRSEYSGIARRAGGEVRS